MVRRFSQASHAEHVGEPGEQQTELVERPLEVVEQDPGGRDEADARELSDEDVHAVFP